MPIFPLACCCSASTAPPPFREADLGPPTARLAPPGRCQLGDAWTACPLLARQQVSSNAATFTFGLPDAARPLDLATCACILARGAGDGATPAAVRPYTPISTNAQLGSFVLLVKRYPGGALSERMHGLALGEALEFRHVAQNVKLLHPFGGRTRIGMVAGGTGITPMLQALHALLGGAGGDAKVSLVYAARTADELLCRRALDGWAAASGGRLTVEYVLSAEPASSGWKGLRGRVGRPLLEAHLPPPGADCLILVCGPPGMYEALCGPRGEAALTGVLSEMGYAQDSVYKL